MARGIIYLFTSLLVFLILTEVITFNINYNGSLILDINFTVFALRLKKGAGTDSAKKSKSHTKFRPSLDLIRDFLYRVIRESDIQVKKFALSFPAKSPFAGAVMRGAYISFISSVLAFAEENAKNFQHDHIIVTCSDHTKTEVALYAKIRIPLLELIISVTALLIKQWLRNGKKYGGKQNERYDTRIP